MKFSKIEFGKARAELEGAALPLLIERGFLDEKGYINELREGYKFLVLGYKGSGKSAIAEKLKLESFPTTETFVNVKFLSDFPFKSFNKILSGSAEQESKFPTSWSWILLLLLFESFQKDEGAYSNNEENYIRAYDALTKFGLLPSNDLRQLVTKSSKTTFKIQLPKIIEYVTETCTNQQETDLLFTCLVDHLKDLSISFKSRNKHFIIIDGLDDILTTRDLQYQSLAALIFEVDRLNLLFMQNRSAAKIILLCRTDLFEKLPGPNKNKIRQDNAIELNWYHDPRTPTDSLLVKMVNLRAEVSQKRKINIFNKYFPTKIKYKNIIHYLLDHTRHSPRDFIQLLNHLKPFYKSGKFSYSEILSGIRDYSFNYFLPEVKDELVGFVDGMVFENFLKLLSSQRKREFSYQEIKAFGESYGQFSEDQIRDILYCMYECSAVTNKWQKGREVRFEAKYRNRHSTMDLEQKILLHQGLWKSLNLV